MPSWPRYAISVYPFLVGQTYPFGPHVDADRRAQVLEMVIAIHAATPTVGRGAPTCEPAVAARQDLDALLQDPDQRWGAGPFSEPARALLSEHLAALSAVVEAFDRLVAVTFASRSSTVITHGEPHAANVMSVAGGLVLIDWDTAGLAPPERDLWMVASDNGKEVARYSEVTGREIDPATMTLYRLRWHLDDIASAIHLFRNRHRRTADTQRWWDGLSPRLEALDSWRITLGC